MERERDVAAAPRDEWRRRARATEDAEPMRMRGDMRQAIPLLQTQDTRRNGHLQCSSHSCSNLKFELTKPVVRNVLYSRFRTSSGSLRVRGLGAVSALERRRSLRSDGATMTMMAQIMSRAIWLV